MLRPLRNMAEQDVRSEQPEYPGVSEVDEEDSGTNLRCVNAS